MVDDTCVGCHMGTEHNYTYEPDLARCQTCHADAKDFDMNGVRTEVMGMLNELTATLIKKGMMAPETGLWIVPAAYPEAVVNAMWNYKFVEEDQSIGEPQLDLYQGISPANSGCFKITRL